jgi:hypothetical protein
MYFSVTKKRLEEKSTSTWNFIPSRKIKPIAQPVKGILQADRAG